ncbi:hypothetical protein EMPS_03317 [Entomortierella parvispora]|uniref:Uncharacterized protein n=1 Tax=Entomortierella parvispora TaxID=205924 RepID=A0A9P3H758_9FUNG|nr:hypothetical protein EMPS_03317 [Entomortierella parvispora]
MFPPCFSIFAPPYLEFHSSLGLGENVVNHRFDRDQFGPSPSNCTKFRWNDPYNRDIGLLGYKAILFGFEALDEEGPFYESS